MTFEFDKKDFKVKNKKKYTFFFKLHFWSMFWTKCRGKHLVTCVMLVVGKPQYMDALWWENAAICLISRAFASFHESYCTHTISQHYTTTTNWQMKTILPIINLHCSKYLTLGWGEDSGCQNFHTLQINFALSYN